VCGVEKLFFSESGEVIGGTAVAGHTVLGEMCETYRIFLNLIRTLFRVLEG
jgi:hypothetical protein